MDHAAVTDVKQTRKSFLINDHAAVTDVKQTRKTLLTLFLSNIMVHQDSFIIHLYFSYLHNIR